MVEMSGPEHYKFMSNVNYIYNESNPLNDHKVNMSKVTEIVNKIRNYKPYELIEKKDTNIIEKNPLDLLTPYRFDLVIKYLYANSIINNYKTDFFKNLYREHLLIWNGFKEYDNPNKNTFESFDNEFKSIIDSIKKDGFDSKISTIPLVENKYMLNGAHRVGASLALNSKVLCRQSTSSNDGQKDCSWVNLFKDLNMNCNLTDLVSLEYAKLKSNTFIVTLFPITQNSLDTALSIIERYGNVVYYKKIELNEIGRLNLMRELYDGESWAGSYKNDFVGFRDKSRLCYQNDGYTTAVLVEFNEYDDTVKLKSELRKLYNVGNHSVHINDTHEQTVRLSQVFFNKNSIHFLNNSKIVNYKFFEGMLKKYKNLITNKSDNYCVTASSVLSIYGLREGDDLDYINLDGEVIYDESNKIHSHNNYGINLYPTPYEEIILNPKYHFYSRGIKFASINFIKDLKSIRKENKDLVDIELINKILN
jgi:hypothetical protein